MPTKGQGWQEDVIPKAYLNETDERKSLSTTYSYNFRIHMLLPFKLDPINTCPQNPCAAEELRKIKPAGLALTFMKKSPSVENKLKFSKCIE